MIANGMTTLLSVTFACLFPAIIDSEELLVLDLRDASGWMTSRQNYWWQNGLATAERHNKWPQAASRGMGLEISLGGCLRAEHDQAHQQAFSMRGSQCQQGRARLIKHRCRCGHHCGGAHI